MSPDQGALQAAPEREVPRRHAVQRRGGEVHVRPRAQGHPARALGEPGRLARPAPRWWTTSPSTSSPRSRTARSSARWPCTARVDRVADRRAEDGRGLQPGAGRHRAVQVRGVEDQHPRHHRAQPRLLGRQGAARPRDLQGGARGRRADDRAPDRRRRHGADSRRRPSCPRCARTRSTPSTRRPASASSSPAATPSCRRSTTCACARRCCTRSTARRSSTTSWRARRARRVGVLAPGVFGYKDMQLDQLYPVRPRQGQGAAGPGGLDARARRHPPEGRAEADAVVAGRARPLSEGRRDHRGDPGHVQGGRGRGQGAVAGVGRRCSPQFRAKPAQPPHVHARLGDVQRGRRLLAVRRSSTASRSRPPAGTPRATRTRRWTRWSSRRAGA